MTARIREHVREAVAREITSTLGISALDDPRVLLFVDQTVMPMHDRLVEELSDQAAALRERNRMYGKASATIGQVRAENAMLRMELAAARLGLTQEDWRRPAKSSSDGA